MKLLITDQMVQAAFDWLQEYASSAAKAKSDRILAEHNVKKVKAAVFKQSDGSIGYREACVDCVLCF